MKATSGKAPTMIFHRSLFKTRVCLVVFLAAAITVGDAQAQLTGRRRTGSRPSVRKPTRPYSRKPAIARRASSPLNRRGLMNINQNGTSTTQINSFLARPNALLRGSSFTAPVRRLSLGTTAATRMYMPTQAEMDRAVQEIQQSGALEQPDRYADFMWGQIVAQRRRLLEDGWAYFKDRDYLRARSAFEGAEMIDSRAPAPRFGQIIVDVTVEHYRRAMTQLARSVNYDSKRPPDVEGLFEYNVSLRRAFGSEDDLRDVIFKLRRFAQQNLDIPPVQALYAYVLWYSRYHDAMIEAASIAARLRRTVANPKSPWAHFDGMIQEARQKIEQARQAGRAADATGPG